MRKLTAARRLVVAPVSALVVLVCAAGCASSNTASPAQTRPDRADTIDVKVQFRSKGKVRTFTLLCSAAGQRGDWRDRGACGRLRANPELAEPITVETKDMGLLLPQVRFTVTGTWNGKRVDFQGGPRGSGTRLGRVQDWWEALGPHAQTVAARVAAPKA